MDQINDLNNLVDGRHQPMTIVEEALSKLKQKVCGWQIMRNIDLEPEKRQIIKHLEEMLLQLRGPASENEDLAAENTQEIENEDPEHHVDNLEVC